MKYLITLLSLFLSYSMYAQEIEIADIINRETSINTTNRNSITITFEIDFSKQNLNDFLIDDESFDDLNVDLNPELISKKYPNLLTQGEEITWGVKQKRITCKISNISDELISKFKESIALIYVKIDKDIIFNVLKNNDITTIKTLKINKTQIEKVTSSKPFLTETAAKELIDAKGGEIFLTQNKFDFGIIPAEQSSSSKTEVNVSFNYRTRYSFLKDKLPVFFSAEGLIGSNSKDSLNYVSIYPVNYNFLKRNNEFIVQVGVEGNQVFSNYRISGNFFWNGIIPNIVDLTFGEDRLRLKPVIKAGIKFYQEIENNRPIEINNNEFSNQVFGEFYYYIPIQKIYSLIIGGTAFYDFNSKVNPDNIAMFNYSATLGIDIPKTDFKTIFKYSKGENGISYQTNDYFMIGLMIDSFGLN